MQNCSSPRHEDIWDTAGIDLRILDLELDVGELNLIRLFWLSVFRYLPSPVV